MESPAGAVGYREFLRMPGVARVFAAGALTRLSYAMFSLAVLLTVQHATHSPAVAGAATGATSITGFAMPLKARLIDRLGLARVLPALSVVFTCLTLALAGVAADGTRNGLPYIVLAAAAGLSTPSIGPSLRALWSDLLPDQQGRQRAYSLDGVTEDATFTLGPALVGLVVGVSGGAAALVIVSATNLAGILGVATSPIATKHARALDHAVSQEETLKRRSPLRQPGFALLLLVSMGFGLGLGPLELVIATRSAAAHHPSASGYLIAVVSLASIAGGLVWGRLTHPGGPGEQLGALLTVTAAGACAVAVVHGLAPMTPGLVLAGLAFGPVVVVGYLASDFLAGTAGRTEATTWTATSINLGWGLGAVVAGSIIRVDGTRAAGLAAAAALLAAAALAFVARARLRPSLEA